MRCFKTNKIDNYAFTKFLVIWPKTWVYFLYFLFVKLYRFKEYIIEPALFKTANKMQRLKFIINFTFKIKFNKRNDGHFGQFKKDVF